MTDAGVLRSRLDLLARYARDLAAMRDEAWELTAKDAHRQRSLRLLLQLAAQCTIDIAAHLVAELALGPADTYRDLFARLERGGHLEPALARRMESWASLRNVLVHLYAEVDIDRLR